MILSVSRRTDIPAFYANWFFKQLEQGFTLVPNPINPQKVAYVPLKKFSVTGVYENLFGEKTIETDGNIEGIVFWTKNPKPLLDDIEKINDIAYYFLFTLNAYHDGIESGLPPLKDRIDAFKELSKHCPVLWRYDPILLADGIDVNWHIKNFKFLCENLKGYTKHCKVSFVIESYSGCSKSVHAPNEKEKNVLLENFAETAQKSGIQIEACAESGDWSKYGIIRSKCIDGEIFENLLTEKYKNLNIRVTRKNNRIDGLRNNCGCMPSVDIGRYDTCKHNCNYCYARKSTPTSMLITPPGDVYVRNTKIEFDYN